MTYRSFVVVLVLFAIAIGYVLYLQGKVDALLEQNKFSLANREGDISIDIPHEVKSSEKEEIENV